MWKLHLRSVKRWVESRKESVEEKTWYALAGHPAIHCTVSLIIIIMIMLLKLIVDYLVCFA